MTDPIYTDEDVRALAYSIDIAAMAFKRQIVVDLTRLIARKPLDDGWAKEDRP